MAHFVIDGVIRQEGSARPADAPDSRVDPDAIAASYWHVLRQPAQRLDMGSRTEALGGNVLSRVKPSKGTNRRPRYD